MILDIFLPPELSNSISKFQALGETRSFFQVSSSFDCITSQGRERAVVVNELPAGAREQVGKNGCSLTDQFGDHVLASFCNYTLQFSVFIPRLSENCS